MLSRQPCETAQLSSQGGGSMSRSAHHNAQLLMRLAAIIVFLGLAAVPVECAAVYGAHSVFISAQEVSALRERVPGEAGGVPLTHHHHDTAGPNLGERPTAHHIQMTSFDSPSQDEVSAPSPASISLDAAVSLCLLQIPWGPVVAAPRSTPAPTLALPGGRFLPAPEPPPPVGL